MSSVGIFLLVGLGGDLVDAAPSRGKAIAPPEKSDHPLALLSQRQTLAANPLCQLASTLEDSPQATLVANATESQDPAPTWVSALFQRFTQSLGLDGLLFPPASPVTPHVAVVPQAPAAANQGKAQLVSYAANQSYQLRLRGQPIAAISSYQQAQILSQQLEKLLQTEGFEAKAIAPTIHQGQPAIALGAQILFVIDETIAPESILNREILAIQWANNLRLALGVPALDLVTAQQQMYQLEETNQSLEGLASWYGPYFHGRLTANGEIYDQYAFTAAHPDLPLNTYLKVTNLNNDRSVIIRLNDRGPYIPPRSLDLSLGAARCLNSVETGVIRYKATIMTPQTDPPKAIAPDMI
ncbi:MAG: septal ring lytic transglycosylase RlpA family protein [Synechococcus sp.]|nr:septal ring lytic transglycosylase RlpA family protein [Synechococcus sp.]